jgi:hypothetical protein
MNIRKTIMNVPVSETGGLRRAFPMEKVLVGVLIAAALPVLAVLGSPIVVGKMYAYSDLGRYHIPLRWFYKQCLSQGLDFSWMPSILCGYYVHGEGQVGMYHPLHLLLYRLLPMEYAFSLEIFLSYPLMLAGLFLFLRRWDLPRSAALFGACTFTFCGFNLLHSMHVNAIAVLAHLPWLLIGIDVVFRAECPISRRRATLGIVLLTASQSLLGFPQSMYFSSLAESLYALLLLPGAWSRQKTAGRGALLRLAGMLALLAGAKALGMLLGAVQLLPTFDLLGYTYRANADPDFRYSFSLEPGNLLQFIGPYFFKNHVAMGNVTQVTQVEFGLYNGALATLFLVWMLVRFRDLGPIEWPGGAPAAAARPRNLRALVFGALCLAGLATILALGQYGLLYRALARVVLIRSFRCSSRHIVLLHLAMAVLAAAAFADLGQIVRKRNPVAWRTLIPLFIPAAIGWIVMALIFCDRGGVSWLRAPEFIRTHLSSGNDVLITPLVMSGATALMLLAARAKRFALLAMVIFAFTDQAIYGLSPILKVRPVNMREIQDMVGTPPGVGGGRIYAPYTNHFSLNNVDNCAGYVGAAVVKGLFYDTRHMNALRLAGVRWASTDAYQWQQPMHWLEVSYPLPRARLVSRAEVSEDLVTAINQVDLSTTAFVDESITLGGGEIGKATMLESEPGRMRIQTESPSRQLLVVSESYHAGWKAWVDGMETPVERVNGDFLGCVVETGADEVALHFQPASLCAGKWLSGASAVLTALLYLLTGRFPGGRRPDP